MDHTTFGFAARMAGGNVRAAQAAGLPVGRLILVTCLLGGAAAGLAGGVEIAAVHMQANGVSTRPRLGYTGILVSFVARHHPLGIIPVGDPVRRPEGGLRTCCNIACGCPTPRWTCWSASSSC